MQTSASLKGVGTVLWACLVLALNPQDGTLLEHLVQTVQRRLAAHDFTSKDHMQSMGTIMGSFVFLRLHIEPPLAELIITRVYQGLLLGAGEIAGLHLVLWACASLGYLPAPHMLHCFKDSYAASKKHSAANLVQCDSSVVRSLAVLGVLDMDYFKMVILRCPPQLLRDADAQQLHQALQALQPSDKSTAAYAEWSQVRSFCCAQLCCNPTSCTSCLCKDTEVRDIHTTYEAMSAQQHVLATTMHVINTVSFCSMTNKSNIANIQCEAYHRRFWTASAVTCRLRIMCDWSGPCQSCLQPGLRVKCTSSMSSS